MTQPKVEKQPIYVLPEMAVKMPKKAETPAKEIKIPFLAEGQKPYVSPYADFYGIDVDKSLVKNVEGFSNVAKIRLKDNKMFYGHRIRENKYFEHNGAKPKTYEDKDGYTTFENFNDICIMNYTKNDNKLKLKNSKNVSVFSSYHENDSIKIENCEDLQIIQDGKGRVTLVDGAADPTKKPALKNSKFRGNVINKLLWTENITEK